MGYMVLTKTFQRLAKVLFVVLALFGLAFTFQAPSYAACMPGCTNNAVCAQRPDNCPNYTLGDFAVLLVTTNPQNPDQPVTRDRRFTPVPGGSPATKPVVTKQVQIGTTASNGTFTNAIPLPNDASLVGSYQDTYYVGGTRGNTIWYQIDY